MEDLLEALLWPEPRARQAWARWRSGIEIDRVPHAAQQMFPALSPAFPRWLEGDPAAGILQGIVRMAWSKNQLRIRKAVELIALLQGAGVRSRVAGPLAWALRTPAPAIRPIPYLTLLVARGDVRRAAEALANANWAPYPNVHSLQELDWTDRIAFEQDGLHLHLHWRLFATPPEDAQRCEKALLDDFCGVAWNQQVFETISKESTLLQILCAACDGDVFPWQADVALVGTRGTDWGRFRRLALQFAPGALERLQELRASSPLTIPGLKQDRPSLLRRKFRYFWGQYRIRSYQRKEKLGWLGFGRFLAERWNLPHVWLVPFAGARRILQHRRGPIR